MALAAGDGAAVVVDAGPDPEAADRCLRELGVSRVPLVLLTHFHADHVAGLPGVLRGRDVGAVQTTGLLEPSAQAEFVHRTAAAARVPVVRAVPGERRRTGPLDWRVLWPPGGPDTGGADPEEPNDASVALHVRAAGGVSLLLLGDLEPPAQRAAAAGASGSAPRGRAESRPPWLRPSGARTAEAGRAAARAGVGRARQSVRPPVAAYPRRSAGSRRGGTAHGPGRRGRRDRCRAGPPRGGPWPRTQAPARRRGVHTSQTPSRISSRPASSFSSRQALTVRSATRR